MKLKSYHFYSKLWQNSNQDSPIKLARNNYASYSKKSIDDLCLKADLCETLDDYIFSICSDMENLINQGLDKEFFIEHPLVLEKLKRIGQDLMDNSNYESDMFYVGAFIDFKMPMYWFQSSFFGMIKNLISLCRSKVQALPESIKRKIRNTIRKQNFNLFSLYFISNTFKKSS
jgi:hypothetical protein